MTRPGTRAAGALSVAVALTCAACAHSGAGAPVRSERRRYTAYHIGNAPAPLIDGRLEEAAWQDATWSAAFVDIEGARRPAPRFRTRMKMLWNDTYLFIAAMLEEPHVWGTITRRDAVIFHDNDFEVFLDPDGDAQEYAELEINALNTVWDLFLATPYRNGGHADDAWDITGLRTAVRVAGTLNDPTDVDSGWTVEMAIPWAALARASHHGGAPVPGSAWRINFSRVEWQVDTTAGAYHKRPGVREDNWVWSPQDTVDMHQPERWGVVTFARPRAGRRPAAQPLRKASRK